MDQGARQAPELKAAPAGVSRSGADCAGCERLNVRRRRVGGRMFMRGLWLALCLGVAQALTAAVRFDVFVGYDGYVPQVGWFPVVCEVENDGPAFNAVFEFFPNQFSQGHVRMMAVELPTGTTKRFSLPVYSSGGYGYNWTARLLDQKGRVRAEFNGRPTRRMPPWQIPITGALARSGTGAPVFPDIKPRQEDLQPAVARLQPPVFPDNPLALEGLRTVYLNSERALELKVKQVNALLAWLYGGGHLVVGVEQISQVNGNEWLRRVLPCDLTGATTTTAHGGLQSWLQSSIGYDGEEEKFEYSEMDRANPGYQARGPQRRRATGKNPWERQETDQGFESAAMQVATGTLRDGRALVGPDANPLVVTARRGRGQVTVLMFSPEMEPFVSWKNRPQFWAKMAAVPPELFFNENFQRYGWRGMDSVFGAIVDSKQIRKLPVGWLMLLLVAYLVVIGPLDRWWLKKVNRQMLTWVTFPIYVALFSGLIYLIGYKLRAGETEWNELHVVDVVPHSERADWRGRTFGSVYSPANASYRFGSAQPFATFRGEYLGSYGGRDSGRMRVVEKDTGFESEVSVPVWTSQLFVSEWWQQGEAPLRVTVKATGRAQNPWQVEVENRLDRPLTNAKLMFRGTAYAVGELPARQTKTITLAAGGQPIADFVNAYAGNFEAAANARQQAFGDTTRFQIQDVPNSAMASSFIAQYSGNTYQTLMTPPGFELTPLVERGDAVLLAWVADYAPVKAVNQFSPRRSHRDTLFRIAVPVK